MDPIALWQPVQESEHYILGQHNGGYFNPKNMSVYGYTYQNPIMYIDPNGKQVEWDKVWNSTKEFFNDAGEVLHNVAESIAPIRIATPEEVQANETRYGKSEGPLDDLKIMFEAISDIPGDLSESLSSLSWEGFKEKWENSSGKEKAEMSATLGLVVLSLKKGKVDVKDVVTLGGKANFKLLSANLLKSAGIDAHQLKHDFLGKKAKISEYDLYKHTDTNEVLIIKKGGKGEPIHTGEFID